GRGRSRPRSSPAVRVGPRVPRGISPYGSGTGAPKASMSDVASGHSTASDQSVLSDKRVAACATSASGKRRAFALTGKMTASDDSTGVSRTESDDHTTALPQSAHSENSWFAQSTPVFSKVSRPVELAGVGSEGLELSTKTSGEGACATPPVVSSAARM